MRVLGIDPGYAIVGYGVIDYNASRYNVIEYGAITTKAGLLFSDRIYDIFINVNDIIKRTSPDSLSIEKLFFNTNTTTAIDVAQARGVILLAAKINNIPIYEYTPLQVKSSVTGYGRAEKKQVMEMTKNILGLKSIPRPDDTADALALAICHSHSAGSLLLKINSGGTV